MSAQTDIATDLTRILGAKSDLKTSIEGKGVTVPAATKIDGYAALVDQIQQGGGGGHTGTVDTVGLTALGWDSTDIQWLQDHCWWDAADDAYWAVTEANKAFGPAGATPLTWSNYSAQKYNPDLRYFPKLTTPSGTSMSGKFSGYVHLVAIPTHGWDMSTKTNYEQCFRNCYSLRSIDVDYWVTTATTTIWLMFNGCNVLSEVNTTHWNTSNIGNFASAFGDCRALTSMDLSSFSFAKATSLQSLLTGCFSLQTLKLPATMSAPLLSDIRTFINGTFIEKVDISFTAAAVTTITSMFNNCCAARSIKLSISSTVLNNLQSLCTLCGNLLELDLTGIDTTACAQTGVGGNFNQSPFGTLNKITTVKLGPNFFKGSFTTLYANQCYSWTRDSIYESLYTNQTSRSSSSPAVTINLAAAAYDRLSASDLSDIATKNFTLTRN